MFRLALARLVEAMKRPGVMGIHGVRRERQCQRDVAAYFRELKSRLPIEALSRLASYKHGPAGAHAAEFIVHRAVRLMRPVLVAVLTTNGMLAYKEGWNTAQIRAVDKAKLKEIADRRAGDVRYRGLILTEADKVSTTPKYDDFDQLGLSGQQAADFAAANAAAKVSGIEKTTISTLQDLVSQAIEEQQGPDWLARQIRGAIDGMERFRSALIASTEMNVAFSTAAMDKLRDGGVEYKQWITSEDACDVCGDNENDGPIPVDELFGSGDDMPPAHPGCRCAVAGARPPEWETEDAP